VKLKNSRPWRSNTIRQPSSCQELPKIQAKKPLLKSQTVTDAALVPKICVKPISYAGMAKMLSASPAPLNGARTSPSPKTFTTPARAINGKDKSQEPQSYSKTHIPLSVKKQTKFCVVRKDSGIEMKVDQPEKQEKDCTVLENRHVHIRDLDMKGFEKNCNQTTNHSGSNLFSLEREKD
jgi:hypothetical protein